MLKGVDTVAPFAGAWIEICSPASGTRSSRSLRSPERGLKSVSFSYSRHLLAVAPFAGAWIEIKLGETKRAAHEVAPFAGAWIEILNRLFYH